MKNSIFVNFSILVTGVLFGQTGINGGPVNTPAPNVTDGVFMKTQIPTKRMVPYEPVREADVIWSKRVWRTLDLREKMNHPLYFPFDKYDASNNWIKNTSRWSLYTVMKHHILLGDLVMYSPYNPAQFTMKDGDEFKYPVYEKNGKNYYNDSVFKDQVFFYMGSLSAESTDALKNVDNEDSTILLADGTYKTIYPPQDSLWTLTEDVIQYRIKEDWFFDKERSVLDVRILGIAPIVQPADPTSGSRGEYKELFWLYFPECRFVFNNYFYFNSQNDASQMSFDDMFWKRNFSSTIYKENNVFDRKIETYKVGVDALMESNKITETIRNFEHDVWSF
jgi:gliding motility associated protien GldN